MLISLKSTILSEIRDAIQSTRLKKADETETAVHSIRRRCKRIRAHLALLPHSLHKQSRDSTRRVRCAAAALSLLRDSHVMTRICKPLRKRLGDVGVEATEIELLAQAVMNHAQELIGHPEATELALQKAASLLEEAYRIVSGLPSEDYKDTTFGKLENAYKACRIATFRVLEHSDSERFHDLRKATKTLYLQSQFVAIAYEIDLQAFIDRAQFLADELGSALDLSVLATNLEQVSQQRTDLNAMAAGIAGTVAERDNLLGKALPIACQLFFAKPKHFRRKLDKL